MTEQDILVTSSSIYPISRQPLKNLDSVTVRYQAMPSVFADIAIVCFVILKCT